MGAALGFLPMAIGVAQKAIEFIPKITGLFKPAKPANGNPTESMNRFNQMQILTLMKNNRTQMGLSLIKDSILALDKKY